MTSRISLGFAIEQNLSEREMQVVEVAIDAAMALVRPTVPDQEAFTEREQQVLRCIVKGRSNKKIGRLLGMSLRTVEAYRAMILAKLQSSETVALARMVVAAKATGHLTGSTTMADLKTMPAQE